jgi:uncharacterized membrane protein YdfJ with MMPL/SSD domain
MEKYMVNYGTGAGNSYHATIDEAKAAAKDGMTYTQQSVKIIDTDTDDVVSVSRWWSVAPTDESDVLCQIGSFGYYADWQDN